MILFLGTRPGKVETKNLGNLTCPHCEQVNTLSASIRPNYFHLFWLPIVKISTWTFVECNHCKKVYHKHEFNEAFKKALHKN